MAKHYPTPVDDQCSFLRQIVDSSPALIHTARPDGYLDFFNQTWLEFVGVPLERLLGWGWTSFIHPDDVEAFVQRMRDSYAKGKPFQETSRVRRSDGVYRWMLHLKVPLFDRLGQLVKWNGSSIDIDDRKRAEETILKSERELRTLIDVMPAFVGTAAPDGSIEFISQGFVDYTGFSREEGMGSGWERAVHPEDRDRVLANWRAGLAAGAPIEHELRCLRADGTYHWFLCRSHPLRDDTGDIAKWYVTLMNIDTLKETESALQAREHQLLGIIETIPSMLWSTAPTGEITHLNQRVFDYCGVTKEEYDERGWLGFLHPDDRERSAKIFSRSIETGEAYDITYRVQRADGVYRWQHTKAEPLRDPHGNITQWYGLSVDIDEGKRAEEAVRKNERELRTLIDAIPAFVGTASPDGLCDFLSESWLNYLGLTKEQGAGWGWVETIHPDDVDRVVATWKAGLTAGEPVEQEMRCRRVDGIYHWFLSRDLPLRDDEQNIIKWYRVLADIDALKKTESALRAREHELRGIIETIPSLLWSTSPTGEVTHLSQRVLEYTGLSLEEFLNLGWKKIIHPDDFEGTAKSFFRAIQTGDSYRATHRLRRKDGEYRWYHASGEPLRDSDGRIIQWYGLSIDIDERKRAEDHLHHMRIKLAKASRLATVAELAASIAHELNQPLTSILANAQAAKRWLNAAPPNVTEVNLSIERVIRDARVADDTMQHIRALFKQESFDKTDVDIPGILREVVRIVQEDPKKRDIPIQYDFEEPLSVAHVDLIQMQQVFINLLVNAIEAMEGQQVARLITLRATTSSGAVLVQVIDNGPGVDDPDRIFDAFMTTKEKGMGIGLAVSRTIVEAHGGRLWAENNKARGATFNVALPLPHAGPAPR